MEMNNISICGSDCSKCSCYGSLCKGCNSCEGKVFHTESGCGIYNCCVKEQQYEHCLQCDKVPCDMWRKTRDPELSDEDFEKNINGRLETLKNR